MARSRRRALLGLLLLASGLGSTETLTAEAAPARPDHAIGVVRHVATEVHGRSVRVAWAAPASGSHVTRYDLRFRAAGSRTWSTPRSTTRRTITVQHLVGGRRVEFEVRAHVAAGSGAWSLPSITTPLSAPGAVRTVAVQVLDRGARVTWKPPVRDGGRRITKYEVSWRTTGKGVWHRTSRTGLVATVTGLSNGRRYSFRVRAVNAVGTTDWTDVRRGVPAKPVPTAAPAAPAPAAPVVETPVVAAAAASPAGDIMAEPPAAQESAVPSAPQVVIAPGVPTDLVVIAADGAVHLSWGAPADGGAVRGYEVRTTVGGQVHVDAVSATSADVAGLTNGVDHAFAVRAVGDAAGSWSPDAVIRPGTPSAPAAPAVLFKSRALDMTASWTPASATANGSPITGWEVGLRARGSSQWDVVDADGAATTATALEPVAGGVREQFSVRAVAEAGPGAWSTPTELYIPDLTLPVMDIDTDVDAATGAPAPVTSEDDYVHGVFSLDPNGAEDATGTGYTALHGTLDIKGHGNSTWKMPKKPYRLKFDAVPTDQVLGMPASKHWILLANALDHSMLRNDTALYIGSKASTVWTPRSRFVEVLLNGDYIGLYQLTEQVRIDPARIPITSMKSKDVSGDSRTGGYELERDALAPTSPDPWFRTVMGQPIAIKDPEPTTDGGQLPAAQSGYIEDYVDSFEKALQSDQRADPATGYAAWADVDSFVDWYVIEEFVENSDANSASQYLFKDRVGKSAYRGGKLVMGPLWDFDLSLGAYGLAAKEREWYVKGGAWWTEFFKDPAFTAKVEQRWHALRQQLPDVQAHLATTATTIATAAAGDQQRWGYADDHDAGVAAVQDALSVRAAWLDEDAQWGTGR